MKAGTILKDTHCLHHESLLVYLASSSKFAKCLWVVDGEVNGIQDFLVQEVLHDREHFPIVGFIDIMEVLKEIFERGIKESENGKR